MEGFRGTFFSSRPSGRGVGPTLEFSTRSRRHDGSLGDQKTWSSGKTGLVPHASDSGHTIPEGCLRDPEPRVETRGLRPVASEGFREAGLSPDRLTMWLSEPYDRGDPQTGRVERVCASKQRRALCFKWERRLSDSGVSDVRRGTGVRGPQLSSLGGLASIQGRGRRLHALLHPSQAEDPLRAGSPCGLHLHLGPTRGGSGVPLASSRYARGW